MLKELDELKATAVSELDGIDNLGVLGPQLVYGEVLQRVGQLENRLFDAPAEREVRQLFRERADTYAQKIMQLPQSLSHEREMLSSQINQLKASDVQMRDIVALERQRRELPHDPEQAKARWEAAMFSAVLWTLLANWRRQIALATCWAVIDMP